MEPGLPRSPGHLRPAAAGDRFGRCAVSATGALAGPGPGRRRGDEAHPGDRLVLQATTGSARSSELRVYRHETDLVLRCSSEPPCARHGDELRAILVLESPGTYQNLLLLSDRPLPEPSSDLDRDAVPLSRPAP